MPHHENMSITTAGLHIHPVYPYLGASPDGWPECTCCGKGVLEIKCPYCKRNECLSGR